MWSSTLLRAIGKDFLEFETIKLQSILKQYDVNQRLKELLRNCKEKIHANPTLSHYLEYDEAGYRSSFQKFPVVVKAYCKIQWILAYEQDLIRNQFLKYWNMLFAKPVKAHLPNGDIIQMYP